VTTLDTLKERYHDVQTRIARAAEKSGRGAKSVVLVAVTKYAGIDQVRELYQLGQRDFGENDVQQLVQRSAMFDEWRARQGGVKQASGSHAKPDTGPRWHVIGHLQRNKVRKACELGRLIHSVDSLRLGEEIQQAATKIDRTVDVLLQVNASGERSKYGCAIAAAPHLAEQIETMVNVRVRGLMTMAPHSEDPSETRETFIRLRELFEEMSKAGIGGNHFNILSMGMSNDFEIAIEEGANLVRVGSAIFGAPVSHPGDGAEDLDE
jgi:pyridoxal phosphate enzyme (YggS family)